MQWHVEIRQDQPLIHQWQELVHVRVWIDVMEANPGKPTSQLRGQGLDVRPQSFATDFALHKLEVETVG